VGGSDDHGDRGGYEGVAERTEKMAGEEAEGNGEEFNKAEPTFVAEDKAMF
jgi:hypothetical protein